jgi:alpha/beta superfamily hydrolase
MEELGISTLRFDFSGHYESGGRTEDLTIASGADDALSAFRYMIQHLPAARYGIVASSFGASAALRILDHLVPLNALCLRAPVSDYAATRRRQLGPDGIAQWKRDGVIEIDSSDGPVTSSYAFYEDALTHDTYRAVQHFLVPTLVIQGTEDNTVTQAESERLCASIGRLAALRMIKDADHGFKNPVHFAALIDLTVDFVTEHLVKPSL